MEAFYKLSQIGATLGGMYLAKPYISKLMHIAKTKEVNHDKIAVFKDFSLSIMAFTFAALMNFIKFGNVGLLVAQLFSAIPLTVLHIVEFIDKKKK